jgi:hypothetical protein
MSALFTTGWSVNGGFFNNSNGNREWVDDVLMDASDPAFAALLMDQAVRHVTNVPAFQGLVCDRLDYSDLYAVGPTSDDGVSWVPQSRGSGAASGPAQSMRLVYRAMFKAIAGVMHDHGAVFFTNCNALCRVDVMAGVDGLFSEGSALNAVAWASLLKPGGCWWQQRVSLILPP